MTARSGHLPPPARVLLVAAAVVVAVAVGAPFDARSELRAGFGSEPLPAPLGGALAGYGGLSDRNATGVLDPPEARALWLEDGDTRVALVAVDLLIVRPSVRELLIAELAPLELDAVLLAATHTHSGPGGFEPGWVAGRVTGASWDPQAAARLARAAARAVQRAAARPVPARVAAGLARTSIPENRSHDDGRRDEALPLLRVDLAGSDEPVLVFALAAHPIVLSNQSLDYSADYIAAARARLDATGFRPLFLAGALGDQRPTSSLGELWPEGLAAQREQAREIGERLAGEAIAGERDLGPSRTGPLRSVVRWVEAPDTQLRRYCAFWWLSPLLGGTVSRFISPEVPFSVLRVGDAIFYGVPAEPTSSLGARLRERSDSASVAFVIAHTNDWMGYAVSTDEYVRGGYEPCMSFFGPDFGPWLIDEALTTGHQLRSPDPAAEAQAQP